MPFSRPILTASCISLCIALQLTGQTLTEKFEDGLSIVTTCKGTIDLLRPDGSRQALEHLSVQTLSGTELKLDAGEHLFLSLSNGIALCIEENSHLRFETYLQLPFRADKESSEYEPSRSRLTLSLKKGSICFSSDSLSPVSEFIIKLPAGDIKILKASGRLQHDEINTQLSILSGIAAYSKRGREKATFLNAPYQAAISRVSAELGTATLIPHAEDNALAAATRRMVDATHRARERVLYKITTAESDIPEPILVARPEDLLKPSPRPYTYLDKE